MAGMRLLHFDGRTRLQTRSLAGRTRRLVPVSLDAAYETEWVVEPDRDTAGPLFADCSPLQLLLGLDGTSARVLELTVHAAGIDWATDTLRKRRMRDGATISGVGVVALAGEALEALAPQLDALTSAAVTLLSADDAGEAWERRAGEAVRNLEPVLAAVTVVPWYDARPEVDRVYDVHESRDLVALAAAELCERGREDQVVRSCGLCGRPFIPVERADEVYCRRAAPGQPPWRRTCREVGPQRRYADELDELTAVYRRAYKRLDVRQRRGGFERSLLDEWRSEARRLSDEARRSQWTPEELARALDDIAPEESQ